MNIDQLIAQASEIFTKLFNEITHLTDNVAISGILEHLWAFFKAIGQFIIIALEAIVRVLKFFIH
ncbi:MAG TPA: hypothetical protein VFD40_01610 [Candidatus Paceibacterota bacterium]|nr:hypothetical protein [Candidatus Paceibacterota bacterium]